MAEDNRQIVWFEEVDKNDLLLVGGKGANLGELTRAGIPVPPGFIVTTKSYYEFIEAANLQEQIEKALEPLNPENSSQLTQISAHVKGIITNAEMPDHIANEIKEAYAKLGGLVAVRSSATAEDLPEASFAGQQSTYLNIIGEDDVITAVQGCWASLFEPRAIFYRHEQGIIHTDVGIAVPVQKMVQSDISGIMFTVEPVTNDNKISIEAIYGLGEAVVSGEVTPDHYLVSKDDFSITEKLVVEQDWMLVKKEENVAIEDETNLRVPVPESDRERQKMSDEEIVAMAKLGVQIEEHYGTPQDIEWAKEGEQLYIVQTRPITTFNLRRRKRTIDASEATVLLSGSPAGPGFGSGPVKIVLEPKGIGGVQEGDVLVAVMTTPDFVPAMKRAAGIVTDKGGRTCHAAIVSRELGIPCVVGCGDASSQLSPEQVITVDGWEGKVYEGRVAPKYIPPPTTGPKSMVKTRTKLYVNLAEPGLAEAVSTLDVDGVGLLRAEFMIAEIGEHPRYMMKEGRGDEFISKLAEGLATFARAFDPRPVVYRATDFKTNEYRHLVGGEEFEEWEENPMIGYRGCSRYIREPDVFKLEVGAIKQVREKYKNLWMMIPFVRTVSEMAEVKKILAAEELHRSNDFKLWMMVEVPSNIVLIDKFLDVGIDGVSIGSNDLTQLTLGVDRDNEELSEQFDERNEAVLVSLEKVIKAATVRGVTCSICGQAPSVYPEITEKLIEWGITSVSVNRDMVYTTREIIAAAELRLRR